MAARIRLVMLGGLLLSCLVVPAALAATAPSLASSPTISGLAASGETLTAGPGTWNGDTPMTFQYQWKRCASGGSSCVLLSGATSSTYVIQSGDVGYSFRIQVTASNSSGSSSATSVNTATVVTGPVAPRVQTLPTVSGTTQQGDTLTTDNGSFTGSAPITYTYQWQRCDSSGNNCAAISGATSQTYLLAGADVGSTLRSLVTATNSAGSAQARSSNAAGPVTSSPVQPPTNSAPPVVSGSTTVGSTVSVNTGSWQNSPTSFAYQWQDCDMAGANCINISGATRSSYTIQSSDNNDTLVAVVTATNSAGSASSPSAATAIVTTTPSAPAISTYPVVTGTTYSGDTLTTDNGTWSNSPTSYSYQWQQCDASGGNCQTVAGQTGTTYALTAADVGFSIRSVVTATNSVGSTTVSSYQTAVIGAGPHPPVANQLPQISGWPNVSRTLSATTGSWSNAPTSYSYQWQSCNSSGASCTPIAGAISASYTLTNADLSTTVRVLVTATNADGATQALSGQTVSIQALPPLPANTSPPTISGIAQQGQTLTVQPGTWTDGYPLSHQWQDCDTNGANCINISGATGSSYVLQASDVGHTIVAVETATNAAGSVSVATAASSVVLTAAPVNTVAPTITGTAQQNQTLTASVGTWANSPTSYSYQWQDCDSGGNNCVNISGATASTYTLASSDVGSTIRVVVTATNAYGSTSAASAATSVVLTAAPVNTAVPMITGTAGQGQTLTASTGSWANSPTGYAYQWQDCDTSGANCVNISGATASTYTLVSSDVGSTIVVVVTATNSAGSSSAASAPTSVVTNPGHTAPVNTAVPTITGTAQEGQTLAASTGTWSNSPTGYSYQWQDCDASGLNCVNISGASSSTYVLVASDVGHTLVVVVTASNTYGSGSAASAPTSVVATGAPVNTALPTISGTAQEGQTLTASTGTWVNYPTTTSYSYQWQDCDTSGNNCVNISGATSSTYTAAASDIGDTLVVVVTATNAYGSTSASSAATAVVLSAAPVNTALPTISGTTQQGQTLTASTGSWQYSPTSYSYQWQDCDSGGNNCVNISGAIASSYTLAASDVGSTIKVVVTATNVYGSTSASSAATSIVLTAAPVNTAVPTINGTAQQGQTLTASTGSWNNTPTGYSYQWQDCDSSGFNCTNISGATTNSYTLAASDIGYTIRVAVTASNSYGSSNATSAATSVVLTAAPVNTVLPAISGSAAVGSTLTASTGTWTNSPTGYAYQWQTATSSSGPWSNLTGATSSTYVVQLTDVGNYLRVAVTATNAFGSATAYSAATAPVAAGAAPVSNGDASITPNPYGSSATTLTANIGTWQNSPTSYSYQWGYFTSNCLDIVVSGATSSTYKTARNDTNEYYVIITATNAFGSGTTQVYANPSSGGTVCA